MNRGIWEWDELEYYKISNNYNDFGEQMIE